MTEKLPGRDLFIGSEFPEPIFDEIRNILLAMRGFDLACYKDACIKRRIALRVRALGFKEPDLYLALLRRDQREMDTLLETLTIHVSQFFRNPSVFAYLGKTVLPEILRRAQATGRRNVRFWSVGCAGGEEAYSLALLMDEIPAGDVAVDILGSDVSPTVLEQAREGLFDPQRLVDVPPEMRERHFSREGRFYRFNRSIREQVRFEQHDILTASEYPAADLILCRNVLIYFSAPEQKKILRRMAAAFFPGGFLVLGRAETLLGKARQLFTIECATERIYRRCEISES